MVQKMKNMNKRQFNTKAYQADFENVQDEQYFDEMDQCENEQYFDDPNQYCNQHQMENFQIQAANYGNNYQNKSNCQNQSYQNQNYQDKQRFYEQRKNKARIEGRCYKCHETGHMIAKCPQNNTQAILTRENVEKTSGNGQRETKQ